MYQKICDAVDQSNFPKVKKDFVKAGSKNFLAENMANINVLSRDAVRFIYELKNSVDENGNPIRLMILSNWSADAFELLYKKNKEFFDIFDPEDIVVSGECGMMKPDPEIYRYIIETHDLTPANCYFIDDEPGNVVAAINSGLKGILHKSWPTTKKRLTLLGLNYSSALSKGQINEEAAVFV